jgi:serine/threonine-protein kinase/endoribonuclease IRE1
MSTFVNNDASAIATLAPADRSAVAAPPARRSSASGLASPQIARSLEDWEVEDFVLLATVDGKLHARDRRTGKERWVLEYETPMVVTKHHREARSSIPSLDEDYDPTSMEDHTWIVEPSRDGGLYIWRQFGPNSGVRNTGLTMKKLVEELAPYASEDPPVVYNGWKKTSMITVDAHTGKVLQYFGDQGLEPNTNCSARHGLSEGECPKVSTLTIGRTEYTVTIQRKKDERGIATLSYSEWSPNNYDHDLLRQYQKTLDNKYIYTGSDGKVLGLDHDRSKNDDPGRLFQQKLSSAVVRVFDVAKPWGDENDPDLIILPQPMPPLTEDDETTRRRLSTIFLNHTEDGSYFAMSGKNYPMAVQGPQFAKATEEGWLRQLDQGDGMSQMQLAEALVGCHYIDYRKPDPLLTISGPSLDETGSTGFPDGSISTVVQDQSILRGFMGFKQSVTDNVYTLFTNPLLWLLVFGFLFGNQGKLMAWFRRLFIKSLKPLPKALETKVEGVRPDDDRLPVIPENEVIEIPSIDGTADLKAKEMEPAKSGAIEGDTTVSKVDAFEQDIPEGSPEKKKKPAHRGRRGGVKHKKGEKVRAASQEPSQDSNPQKPAATIDDAVRDAQKNVGREMELEPDIRTIPSDPQEVSGPILRIGNLEVDTEKLIGTGSNGTTVFEGKFDGRAVAVKRMLIQFFDIASQETKLLRESDDHPNVIRYYNQQQAGGFLYIALELCPASLAEVIDKPQLHRELAQAGERDLPDVLYQITNGLRHLHSLRIVHRDLKPQNILVALSKEGKPRLLVSDFGLCKKLDNEQSSFRATTAHAAGTSGWRAPELLLDDDAKDGHQGMVDASTDGNSGSIVLNPDLLPNRRATRAIDIFSLGLVFFYVLTKGCHPFDCGDKFMREVNIRKGKYDLTPLDVLGDYAFEAKDLIGSMLEAEPKKRPQASQVMAHPFFWSPKKRLNFLCDVSDHFEKEKRDPPTDALVNLEDNAPSVCGHDFLKPLGKEFVDSLGKQRKYTGTRLLDLLRALRNKKNHYEDMSDKLKKDVGPLPEGYLSFWTRKFPNLLITCWNVVYAVEWDETDRFKEYYMPGYD